VVEAVFLHRPVVGDPCFLIRELMGTQAAIPHSTHFFGDDEPRVLQDFYVLLDAREGHLEALRQLADRRIPSAKPLENPPTGGVGKRGEGVIEASGILNHMVQFSAGLFESQGRASTENQPRGAEVPGARDFRFTRRQAQARDDVGEWRMTGTSPAARSAFGSLAPGIRVPLG